MAVIATLGSLGASIYLAAVIKNGEAAAGYAFLSVIFALGAWWTGPKN